MKLKTLQPRIAMLPDRLKTLRTPRKKRPAHASQDKAAQAQQARHEAGAQEATDTEQDVSSKRCGLAAPSTTGAQ